MKKIRPILFIRIAQMHYYKGVTEDDIPTGGGAYVDKYKDGHESCYFLPTELDGVLKCLGFGMISSCKDKKEPTLHIERIVGCSNLSKAETAEDVIVVFCTKSYGSHNMRVCGFYKNATVYRNYQDCYLDDGYVQSYITDALSEDCVLLPFRERFEDDKWMIPISGKWGFDFGFGRSNIWYCNEASVNPKAKEFLTNMIESIETYDGENWV